ncbi:hypothetical protein GS18_0200570 [Metabacillus indicus]|uniref:Uncharacterized protein n=1 Tax=Metabacillus indicus TaxID=246786 RepID=A0A084H1R0_METID|nr:hypothetical protein GS18_0200570 [Metabacillus indicus]
MRIFGDIHVFVLGRCEWWLRVDDRSEQRGKIIKWIMPSGKCEPELAAQGSKVFQTGVSSRN